MQSGQATLAGIEDALRDLKGQETSLRNELEEANRVRATLVAERLEGLRRLAAIRARDAVADGVIDDADQLTTEVRAILEARLKTISQLRARSGEAEAAREAHVARQDELTRRIASLEEQLDRFGAQARAALAGDAEHVRLAEAHRSLSSMLEQATAKAEQAARDEHEKGLPYRNDPLFMYLWRRQQNAPSRPATGLVRALDDWVARLVRYSEARANYALLTEIPVRLRAHVEDLRRQTVAAKQALDELEARKTREVAGADLVAELEAERGRQTQLGQQLETITSELTETASQLKTYAKGEDTSFQSAVNAYSTFLEREPLRRLLSEAAATATKEDDRMVEEVRQLATKLDELETGAASRRRRLDQLSDRREELTRLASNFRRQRYDDVGSTFSDSPRTEDLLQLLLRGAITAVEYWARMQAQQQWRQRPGDPWRRQSGLPPFDGFPGGWGGSGSWGGGSGDGNRGGGSSSSGGGSGRDFETGGTF
ncbi:MAG: hypothetical protein AB7O57_24325 [Hyphomicrobiaceae bacterium]